jgi:hypothetical protein
VLVGLVVAVVRAWTSRERRMYGITPDEPGQLAIARFVSGLPRWNMFDHSTWRPLYGTLIAPLHWVIDDPTRFYEAAHIVNALLGGVAAALTYLLARRLTDLAPLWSAAVALVVSLAPAILFTTDYVWAESLVAVVYTGAVLALLWFHDAPSLSRGVLLAVLSVAGYLTHTRLLPMAIVSAGVVVFAMVRRRLPLAHGAVVLATFLGLYVAGSWYSELLVDRIWEQPSARNSYGGVADQLQHVSSVLVSLVGQLWYQLVTTAGLFGIGVVATVQAARRRRGGDETSRRAAPRPSSADARLVLLVVGALGALSVVFMTDRWRPDQIVYGRYNDAVVGPLLVIAFGWLLTRRRLAVTLLTYGGVILATLLTGLLVNALRADQLAENVGVRVMILGLQTFLGTASAIRALPITLAGVVVMAAVALLVAIVQRTGWRAVLFVGLALLMVLSFGRTRARIDAGLNAWAMAGPMEPVRDDILADQDAVRMMFVPDSQHPTASLGKQRQRRLVYQFYLPHQALYTDGLEPDRDAVPYVFAPLLDPTMLANGAELVWSDPSVAIGLWFDP